MLPLTVTTPLHAAGRAFIDEAYRSLVKQTHGGWTWMLLENHGGSVPPDIASDPRVRVLQAPPEMEGIGALKRRLAEEARALGHEHLVELDCDDLLVPTALERVSHAFKRDGADFVYSDFAEFKDEGGGTWLASWLNENGTPAYPYGAAFGWKSRLFAYEGRPLYAMHAPEVTAHNVRRVEWAPNHVRAWRAEAYWEVGGHDAGLPVCDDHDLVLRMFLRRKRFVHVPEVLYLYRVHGGNTVSKQNTAIQAATNDLYNLTIWPLAERFAEGAKLAKVDLCGGLDAPPGYLSLDREGAHVDCDLDGRWPLEDSSVGVLRAHDAVEHLRDPVHTMNEAYRVLAPGGFFMILVPSTSGKGAFCDPTHVSFWNDLSFRYYSDAQFARYVRRFKGRFQVSRCLEFDQGGIPYVAAHLFCAKDGFRAMGDWGW